MKHKAKQLIKLKARNFMSILLEALADLADSLPRPLESKHEHQCRLLRKMQGYPPERIALGVSRLKKRGLIHQDAQLRFKYNLTLNGRQRLLLWKIKQKRTISKNTATIIIFDIPEKFSRHRSFLRRLLIKNGFINLQKSVLISRYELPQEFFDLLKELKIRQFVTLIKGQVFYP